MKAPDKIYMPNELLSEEWTTHIDGDDIEYIRKEALLEWIQEVRALPRENAITRDLTFQEVVNKLNSM